MNPLDCCRVIQVVIGVVLAVLGSVLMGTAPSPWFNDAQFIVGFVFVMLFAIFIVNVLLFCAFQDEQWFACFIVFANICMLLTIIGAVCVGLSPSHAFVSSNSMFLAGFSLLIIMATIVVICLVVLCVFTL